VLEAVADNLGWIVAICGALGTIYVLTRKAGRKAQAFANKANQVSDVLLGRPAILHPETGEVLVDETPGIGTRMAHIERWQSEAVPILKTLAETQSQLAQVYTRLDSVESRLEDHLDWHNEAAG
jgi:hypothetical protein